MKKVNFIELYFTLNILKCPENNVPMIDDKLTVLKCIKKKVIGWIGEVAMRKQER